MGERRGRRQRPSAALAARKQLFEAEAQKDELHIQLASITSQFQARENWWRTSVMEMKNQAIDGVLRSHQFEFEARQQWEQRLRSVESSVDEASTYCENQAYSFRDWTSKVIQLEEHMASTHAQAHSEIARLGQQVNEESEVVSR